MNLILFVLSCYGVTNIVTQGKIFERFRERLTPNPMLVCVNRMQRLHRLAGQWIRCPMCMGVPVGVGWYAAGLHPGISGLQGWLAAGFVSSAGCWILFVAMRALGDAKL